MSTKFIFVTGGVVSGLGKGICAASLGRLLKQRGLRVRNQKFDPYLNVDPGTMSPFQHGEVFVTEDGAETDLDLGHYERFVDEDLSGNASVSSGRVWRNVLNLSLIHIYSSFLEHGGSPEKATKSAFVSAIDKYLRGQGKYQKSESKITWQDVEDCLILVSNNFSTQTSYENQTKKAINNKFVQEAMTEFLRSQLEVYFIENRFDADKIAEQVLINKRSRESAEKARLNTKTCLLYTSRCV